MFWKPPQGNQEKERVRSIFEHLVSPSVVDQLLKGEVVRPPFAEEQIEFVFAIAAGCTPEEVNQHLSLIGELAKEQDAQINQMLCSLAVVDFRFHPKGKLACESRRKLVEVIRENLGNKVKVVHGAANGHYGVFGSDKHIVSYTFSFPEFEAAIALLTRLKFGEIEELHR